MARGKLIVFEGIDGAGKGTQVARLVKRLKREGKTVTVFSFPRYHKPIGRFIRAALSGQFGDFVSLSAPFSAFPYMVDMALAQAEINAALSRGTVISDRYMPSTIAYHGAKLSGTKRSALMYFLERFAYKDLAIRKPDMVVYLDMPVRNARALLLADAQKGAGKLDQYEADMSYQKRVAAVYHSLRKASSWHTIACTAFGKTRSIEDIHAQVWQVVRGKIR